MKSRAISVFDRAAGSGRGCEKVFITGNVDSRLAARVGISEEAIGTQAESNM